MKRNNLLVTLILSLALGIGTLMLLGGSSLFTPSQPKKAAATSPFAAPMSRRIPTSVVPTKTPMKGALARTRIQTGVVPPPATPTITPTVTLEPPTPVPSSTLTLTPTAYTPVSIALGQPGYGVNMAGLVTFTWLGSLSKGQVFDVRICPGPGCTPQFGKTNTTDTTWVWCPDGGAGIYRWQVVVIDESTKQDQGPRSEIGEFLWEEGGCEPGT